MQLIPALNCPIYMAVFTFTPTCCDRHSSVGIATRYVLVGLRIESFPVVELSEARVWGRSLTGVADSNPKIPRGGMDICVVCCK
jgi:hypothetical protein